MGATRALAVVVVVVAAATALGVEAPLPRHPAPSPDGTSVAFSWQGDLWIVPAGGGQARRLTAHPAAERHPVWSRDGSWIAFASDRYGNLDVFALPTDGSAAPRRLTFASVDDQPVDFSADGNSVLFTSDRAESLHRMPGLYTVPLGGGTPALSMPALGRLASYSPDGRALAFVRGDTEWARRGYRGAANRDIWLYTADREYVRLTDFEGDDDAPCWVDDHTLTFLSARSGRKNVFLLDLVTAQARQLTHHQGTDVRFPRLSADGSLLAYEFEDAVWTVPAGGGEPTRLHVEVPADQVANLRQRRVATKNAEQLALSPDGTLAAFVVHGEVFVTAVLSKEDQEIAAPPTVQVTATQAPESDLAWAPDGSRLLFSSARAGNLDLFLTRREDDAVPWTESFTFPVEQLTSSPAEEHLGEFSPDGGQIAFVRGKGELVVLDLARRTETVLLEHWATPEFEWSPDGEWLAYSTPDMHDNSEVWIVPAAGGEAYNVSRHPDDDTDPRWSPDGKRLVWISERHGLTADVWGTWLQRADHQRTPAEWLAYWKEKAKAEEDKKESPDGESGARDKEGEEGKPAKLPQVRIDFDGLWERATAITELKGDEGFGLVSPDGKRVVFSSDHEGERDLYSVRWDGKDITRLTEDGQEPEQVQFERSGKTLFYLDSDGVIKRVGLDAKAGDPVPFAARYEVDAMAERGAVFDQAWRALDEWFYDPDFHGVDWQAMHDIYRPWALAASHERDFEDVMNLMLGELNSSHQRYRGPRAEVAGEQTGWIGAAFDPAAGGPGILVAEVLRDSPADRHDVALRAGERILAVNGQEVGPSTNVFELFADTVQQRVALTVRAVDGAERRVVVIPCDESAQQQYRYQQWVRERRQLVEELSQGRLGYLHIQGMSIPSFEEFERDLYAAGHDREGLIIDVRSNGGGWTTDYLLAVLNVRRHAFTVPRDADPAERAYPQSRLPLAAWTKPALTLCNEESYSNAEVFSWAFQELRRGLLVGWPTFGAVISTGSASLLNGGVVRLPMRGMYVAGTGLNMENNGARPDVLVAQPPEQDTATDRDNQLEKAVAIFLAGIEKDPRYGAW